MSAERAKRTVKLPKKFDELEGGSQATTAWLWVHGLQGWSCHVPAYYGCPGVIVAQQWYCKGFYPCFSCIRPLSRGSPIMGKHSRILNIVLLEESLVWFACTLLSGRMQSVRCTTSALTMLGMLARIVTQHNNFCMATVSMPFWLPMQSHVHKAFPCRTLYRYLHDVLGPSSKALYTFHLQQEVAQGMGSSLALN